MSILTMITGIPKWARIALASVAAAALMAGAFTIYVNGQRRDAVEAERNKVALEAANTALEADRAATVNQDARDEANRTADDATRKDIDDAIAQNPESARAPAGPVTRRAIDSLRNRSTGGDTAAR